MFKLFNTYTRETSLYQFLDYENAKEEAHFWSKDNDGAVVIINTENGRIRSVWNDGECSYEID